MCCCVLQCVAVYCSVLLCATTCCSLLQCVAVCSSFRQVQTSFHLYQRQKNHWFVAVCCSVLQCVAVCCSVCVAVRFEFLALSDDGSPLFKTRKSSVIWTAHGIRAIGTHYNALQHTLQHTATHTYNTLQHTATHCNTLQHAATHCNTLPYRNSTP